MLTLAEYRLLKAVADLPRGQAFGYVLGLRAFASLPPRKPSARYRQGIAMRACAMANKLCGKGFLIRIGLPRHRGNVRGYYLLTLDGEAALAAWLKEDN